MKKVFKVAGRMERTKKSNLSRRKEKSNHMSIVNSINGNGNRHKNNYQTFIKFLLPPLTLTFRRKNDVFFVLLLPCRFACIDSNCSWCIFH